MKKSVLAFTIASTFSLPIFASPAQVDRTVANSHTNQLIAQQMTDIDAHVLAQLNAQPNNVAVVDDVVYEKQSDGTWAAIGAASATLVAGLLSTSSSDSSSDATPQLPMEGIPSVLPQVTPSNPVEGLPALPMDPLPSLPAYAGEAGGSINVFVKVKDNGAIVFTDSNGEVVGRVDKAGKVYVGGEVVGSAEYHGHNGNQITISLDNGATINYKGFNEKNKSGTITLANGDTFNWSPEFGLVPADGVPTLPIYGGESNGIVNASLVKQDNGVVRMYDSNGNQIGMIDQQGKVFFNGKRVGSAEYGGHKDNNITITLDSGATIYYQGFNEKNQIATITRANGDVYSWSSKNGQGLIKEGVDGGWENDAPKHELPSFELDGNTLEITYQGSTVTLVDTPAGVIIQGEGTKTIDINTANAYKAIAAELDDYGKKMLAVQFVAFNGQGVVDEELRRSAWDMAVDHNKEWAQNNKAQAVKLIAQAGDAGVLPKDQYNLAYFMITGKKTLPNGEQATSENIKSAVIDRGFDIRNTQLGKFVFNTAGEVNSGMKVVNVQDENGNNQGIAKISIDGQDVLYFAVREDTVFKHENGGTATVTGWDDESRQALREIRKERIADMSPEQKARIQERASRLSAAQKAAIKAKFNR